MIRGTWNKPEDRKAATDFLNTYRNVGEWQGVFEDASLPSGDFTLDERRLSLSTESYRDFIAAIRPSARFD